MHHDYYQIISDIPYYIYWPLLYTFSIDIILTDIFLIDITIAYPTQNKVRTQTLPCQCILDHKELVPLHLLSLIS